VVACSGSAEHLFCKPQSSRNFFSASDGEFASYFQRFCSFFHVPYMMFEAFGMSGRVGFSWMLNTISATFGRAALAVSSVLTESSHFASSDPI